MSRILFIEDTTDLHSVVAESLMPEHSVTCVTSLSGAREKLSQENWDLLLVDVGLNDGDGFEFVRNVHSKRIPQFIFLTGRSDTDDKIRGFELGAQDYVTKPFDVRELRARINARLSSKQINKISEEFENNTFKIDVPLQRAYLINSDQKTPLNLTPIEFKLLYYFCTNENRVIQREEILKVVWGQEVNVLERTIDKHISSLRQKLGTVAQQIETIPQIGYCYSS